jgi:hypothetical protein
MASLTYDTVYLWPKRKYSVFVDAAAEMLTIPTLICSAAQLLPAIAAESACAPQCSGLILGRKDLLQAAWSSARTMVGRAMKIGKKNGRPIGRGRNVGAAITRRRPDVDAVDADDLRSRGPVDGVSAVIRQPKSIDNHSPSLAITWDPAKLGITGGQLADLL